MMFKKNGNSRIVYTVGAPVLREIAAPVAVVDDQIRQLAADMIDAMGYFNGIGLAAPQYGKSLRLVVIDVPQESNTGSPGEVLLLPKMPLVLVNPEIMDGDFIEIECGGLLGRCIQHELDHLDGKLFTDRVEPDTARQIRGDLDRLTRIGQSRNFRRNK